MHFARSLATVSSLTVVSRVGGFIRDTLTALVLGAGPVADAYFVAQRLPNLFRTLFAEGAFSAAFVPLYTTEREKHGEKIAQDFAGHALALLLSILVPFSALMMTFMPTVIRVIAPGFDDDPQKFGLAVTFSTICFPYLAFISLTALQGGILNAHGKFAAAAAAPIALNIVMVIGLILCYFYHLNAGLVLSWTLTLGGVTQFLWLAVSCYRARVSIPLLLPQLGVASKKLFKRIGPGAVGAGAGQINLFLSNILASLLPTGSISYLFYADRLNQLPLGIVGIAVGTTLLPLLSRHVENKNENQVRHYTNRAIEFCLLLGLPAAFGLALASKPIIQTLFEHGAFSHNDTIETAKALAAYAIGVPAFLLVKALSAGFFARHDTSTPVKTAIAAMLTNVVFAILLLKPLHHTGIALASSIAVWTNVILLYARARHMKHPIGDKIFKTRAPRILLCSFAMAAVTYGMVIVTNNWLASHHYMTQGDLALPTQDWLVLHYLLARLLGLMAIICVSSLAYAVMLEVTGAMRLRDVLRILKRKG